MLATNKKKKILNTAQAYAGLRTRSLELVGLWTHDHGMIERQTDRHTYIYILKHLFCTSILSNTHPP